MGIFDFLKNVTDDNVERTTTIRYATDAQSAPEPVDNSIPEVVGSGSFRLAVQDVFTITGRGTVVTGTVEVGQVSVGETVRLRRTTGECSNVTITGIEVFRKMLDTATEGMNVGVVIRDITKNDIGRGDVLER